MLLSFCGGGAERPELTKSLRLSDGKQGIDLGHNGFMHGLRGQTSIHKLPRGVFQFEKRVVNLGLKLHLVIPLLAKPGTSHGDLRGCIHEEDNVGGDEATIRRAAPFKVHALRCRIGDTRISVPIANQGFTTHKTAAHSFDCFPAVGRKQEVDDVVVQLNTALQISVTLLPDTRSPVWKIDVTHGLSSTCQPLRKQARLCTFT
mmetsp:Transcript_66092/g.144343  ORF Transcript_66092/g.144343 Transcript_66092/m.144343 type:complete len:203 (-) Transcript_66092:68-676(-)